MIVQVSRESIEHWNTLHSQPRFRPQYPSEHVVRFLMNHFPPEQRLSERALDIGMGGGRHTKLLCELGFQTYGVDISDEGLRHCHAWLDSLHYRATLQRASMGDLPFARGFFDLAISFGVYYYADAAGMARAVAELHRVLARGGRALVVLRTLDDYRYGKGIALEENTFRLEIEDTNECGTVQHFVEASDVPILFQEFSEVQFETTETTFHERRAANSDWLITVRK
jgi:SAM-dependent methyltransferase